MQHQIDILERYLPHVYYPKQYVSNHDINEVRMLEFESNANVNLRHLPPPKVGLVEHLKCSSYQAGWVWTLCHKEVVLPDPVLSGWRLSTHNEYVPLMYTQSLKLVLVHQQNAKPASAANTNIHVYHFVNVKETVLRFKREPID